MPLADSRLSKPVAFTALVDGPAVTTGEEEVWSDAAGEDEEGPLTAEKKAEATQKLQEAGPSGFDPAPLIEQMSTPGLWLYGGADKSIPDRSKRGDPEADEAGGEGLHDRRIPRCRARTGRHRPDRTRSTRDPRQLDQEDRGGGLDRPLRRGLTNG